MKNDKFKILDKSGDRKYFTIIPNYIVNHSTVYEQAIYLQMKRIAGEEGTCWMSAMGLAKRLGCSRNTVAKYQKKLVDRGWIQVVGKRQTGATNQATIEYRIVDLWELNTKYYSEKNKRSTDERLPQSYQPLKGSVQPVNEKGSVVEHKEELNQEDLIKKIESIYTRYQEKINDSGQLTSIGKKKIANRLRVFSAEELIKAIDNFSRDDWCMKNNARRGVAWFFDNNERIDQFLSFPKSKFDSIKSHKIDLEYDSITIKA